MTPQSRTPDRLVVFTTTGLGSDWYSLAACCYSEDEDFFIQHGIEPAVISNGRTGGRTICATVGDAAYYDTMFTVPDDMLCKVAFSAFRKVVENKLFHLGRPAHL